MKKFRLKEYLILILIATAIKHYVYKILDLNFNDGKIFSLNNLYDIIATSIIYGTTFLMADKFVVKKKENVIKS